jgi:O-antigen ligase
VGVAVLLSQLNAVDPRGSVLAATAVAVFWIGVPFVGRIMKTPGIQSVVISVLSVSTIAVLIYVFLYARHLSAWADRIGPLALSVNNIGGVFVCVAGILAVAAFDRRVRQRYRFASAAIVSVISLELIFLVGSRAAILGLFLTIGMAAAVTRRGDATARSLRTFSWMALIVVAVLVVVVLAGGVPERMEGRFFAMLEPRKDPSTMLRVSFAKKAWRMFCDYPFLGGGWDNFVNYEYSQVAFVSGDRTGGRYVSSDRHWPHSFYLKYMGETGVAGFVPLLCLMAWGLGAYARLMWSGARASVIDAAATGWIPGFGFFVFFHDAPGYLSFVLFGLAYGRLKEVPWGAGRYRWWRRFVARPAWGEVFPR